MKTKNTIYLLLGLCLLNIFSLKASEFKPKNTPIGFIENKGQIMDQNYQPNNEVKYLLNLDGLNVQLKQNSFSYDSYIYNETSEASFHRVDIELVGANTYPQIETSNPSTEYFNYYNTAAPNGALYVRHYSEVVYKGIYNGIDLVFKAHAGTDKQVEYDFIVHPGADASQIKMKYHGALSTQLKDGKIELELAHGTLSERIPFSYLIQDQMPVAVNYSLQSEGLFAFAVAKYNSSETLVIDPTPTRDWGTYYGGSSRDYVSKIGNDVFGDIYVAGASSTSSLPANNIIATSGSHQSIFNGLLDAFIAKFSAAGVRQWATYMGGSGNDFVTGLKVTSSGNLHICGSTTSTEAIASINAFQATRPFATSSFISKFTTNGLRSWGTYIGQSTGPVDLNDLAIDGLGNTYAVGSISSNTSTSTVLTTTGTHQKNLRSLNYNNGIVIKLNASGNALLLGTCYGGTDLGSGTCHSNGTSIALDASNKIYISGNSECSQNIASTNSNQSTLIEGLDGFLVKFNTDLTRDWATYFGTSQNDFNSLLTIDNSGNIIVASNTQAGGGSTADIYLAKFTSLGAKSWGKNYGGNGADQVFGLDVNTSGDIFIGGFTSSTDNAFASTGAYQTTNAGGYDGFIGQYSSSTGNYVWKSYFGGTGTDQVRGLTVYGDKLYVAGSTTSPNNISTTGAHQTSYGGSSQEDGYIQKFDLVCDLPNNPTSITGEASVCAGSSKTYSTATISGATAYEWTLPNGWTGTSTSNSITVTVGTASGTISVKGSNACGLSTLGASKSITVSQTLSQPSAIEGSASVCANKSEVYSIQAVSGASSYVWSLPSGWVGSSTSNTITATTSSISGTISVVASNVCGNNPSSSLSIQSSDIPSLSSISGDASVCNNTMHTYSTSSVPNATYTWTLPKSWSGKSSNSSIEVTALDFSGSITVSATNTCGTSKTISKSLAVVSLETTVSQNGDLLSVAPTTSVTYQWLQCEKSNFTTIKNATQSTYMPDFSASYAVKVTKSACVDTSNCFSFEKVITALESGLTTAYISVSNPVHEKVWIQNINPETQVIIQSVDGKEVFNGIYPVSGIYSENWSEGIYIVTLIDDKTKSKFKIVKM